MAPADVEVRRVVRSMASVSTLDGSLQRTWDEITDVDIADYTHPAYLKLLGIPHPLRAEVRAEGVGGERIAYFDTGKRFIQRIITWEPLQKYAFTFNPEKGFTVAFFFDLSDGPVQIPSGSYHLEPVGSRTRLTLATQYSLDRRADLLLRLPVALTLRLFQRYLLRSISRNVARHERP